MSSSLNCRYLNPDSRQGFIYRFESFKLTGETAALVCINIHGLLLDNDDPCYNGLLKRYSPEEARHRDLMAKNRIVPVMRAARSAGMPVVYVSDSIPNIALDRSNIGEIYRTNIGLFPEKDFAEGEIYGGH